ncbi:NADPH-dependent F420 reductase, partial [Leucobacter sp. M11]|uniref:NADPH-dependent F420 reductase n=1 Tax=Leucobacter sp. M11 TaxID=2993565 RepID=UPI002D80C985
MTTLGILGAGKVGTTLARGALAAGYDVRIAASGPAAEIALIVEVLAPGAIAADAAEVVAHAELIVLATPLRKYRGLDAALLAGKPVLDAMNHWADTDGALADLAAHPSSSEMVAAHLPGALLGKSLNHIGYHELEEDGQPAGSPGRRALAVATDHEVTRDLGLALIERLGFDAVDAGPLAAGRALEPGTPIFVGAFERAELRTLLTEAG